MEATKKNHTHQSREPCYIFFKHFLHIIVTLSGIATTVQYEFEPSTPRLQPESVNCTLVFWTHDNKKYVTGERVSITATNSGCVEDRERESAVDEQHLSRDKLPAL